MQIFNFHKILKNLFLVLEAEWILFSNTLLCLPNRDLRLFKNVLCFCSYISLTSNSLKESKSLQNPSWTPSLINNDAEETISTENYQQDVGLQN